VLETRTVVWTGGIHITQLTQESGMTTGSMGRVVVDENLRSVDFPFVYAIGDNALAINPQTGKPVPAAAQFAL
jgi:NADH dehydrogenase